MNCCDEYGDCRQSDDCPIRTGVVLPHQAACARRRAAINSAPEGGNFYPDTPEPVTLNVFESIALYLLMSVLGLISFGLLAAGAGSLFLHFYH
jgi:hypothetical protein